MNVRRILNANRRDRNGDEDRKTSEFPDLGLGRAAQDVARDFTAA